MVRVGIGQHFYRDCYGDSYRDFDITALKGIGVRDIMIMLRNCRLIFQFLIFDAFLNQLWPVSRRSILN